MALENKISSCTQDSFPTILMRNFQRAASAVVILKMALIAFQCLCHRGISRLDRHIEILAPTCCGVVSINALYNLIVGNGKAKSSPQSPQFPL